MRGWVSSRSVEKRQSARGWYAAERWMIVGHLLEELLVRIDELQKRKRKSQSLHLVLGLAGRSARCCADGTHLGFPAQGVGLCLCMLHPSSSSPYDEEKKTPRRRAVSVRSLGGLMMKVFESGAELGGEIVGPLAKQWSGLPSNPGVHRRRSVEVEG